MIVDKIFGKNIDSLEESDLKNIRGIPETRSVEFKTIPKVTLKTTLNVKKK